MPRGRPSKRAGATAVVKPEPVDEEPPAAAEPEPMIVDGQQHHPVNIYDDDDDDDDPIVREIEVFISPDLASTAALVQYPLRPSSFVVGRSARPGQGSSSATDDFTPVAARTKPRHSMLELDYALPSSTYGNYFQSNVEELTDTRTFASQSVPISTHMALGKLDDTGKRLDLIPLNRVLQMRPSFAHIDSADPNNAAQNEAQQQQQIQGTGAKPLLFKKNESDRAASARRQSFAHLKSERDAEEWVDLHVVEQDDVEYQQTMAKVACKNRSHKIHLAKTAAGGSKGYVDSLNYLPTTDLTEEEEGVALPNVVTDTAKYKTELTAKIATLLTASGGNPVPYPVFRSRFVGQDSGGANKSGTALTEEMLIECLSSAAALVRGNFVLKTSLCGLSPSVAEARDVCLVILNKYGCVRRQSLLSALTETETHRAGGGNDGGTSTTSSNGSIITEHIINKLLEPIATKGYNCMKLRVEDDDTFPIKFPLQAENHKVYWEKKEEALQEYVTAYEELEGLRISS